MENKNLIVETWNDNLKKFDFVHNHLGFECDSCKAIPDTIFVCWFQKGYYLRYLCFNCKEHILNTEGYLSSYLDLLKIETLRYRAYLKLDMEVQH